MIVSGRKSVNRPQAQYSSHKKARKPCRNAGFRLVEVRGVEPEYFKFYILIIR